MDIVNHPAHYKTDSIECIDAMEAAFTPEEFRGHCKACAMKYIWRDGKKKGAGQEIGKAIWYLTRIHEDK